MIPAGAALGPYEILAPLGHGGMGEVYRARDRKLGREVALKVLPDAFVSDADRVARFEREAQVLASLNHPGIAVIYGLEVAGEIRFLAMELVDGESLADRIARTGALPIEEVLGVVRQLAEALDAAHAKGIVHRDLKPANVMLTRAGQVKVLDFGLAKVNGGPADATELTQSPTILGSTTAGLILGTAAYMSPEQAKGYPADKRSDLWSFGCIAFEMLTGRRPFEGETITDTLAAVLRADPDWSLLPPTLPPGLGTLVRRSLEKDRTKRLGDVSVALFLLSEPETAAASLPAAVPPHAGWRRAAPAAAAAVIAGAIGAATAWALRPPAPAAPVTRFAIPLGDGEQFTNTGRSLLAISPDGTKVVYVANQRLYLRAMSEAEAHPIAGSESTSTGVTSPVFSPDGQWVAFYAQNAIRKISVAGGAPVTLCPATNPYGISWSGDQILFGQGVEGISRVSAFGGIAERVVTLKPGELAHGPQMLPGGDAVLFTLVTSQTGFANWDKAQIVAQRLRSGERKVLVSGGADARYVRPGHLVYALNGVLMAVRFDVRGQTTVGGPVPVLEGVLRAAVRGATGTAQFATSETGTLVYVPGPASNSARTTDVAIFDRQGNRRRLSLPPVSYIHPRVSPDGKWLAIGTDDGVEAAIWIYDLSGATSIRRLTFGGRNQFPVWSPDSQTVAFQSDREGDQGIFRQRADGSGVAERLTKGDPGTGLQQDPESWSPDGRTILFSRAMGSNYALHTVSLPDKRVAPVGDVASVEPLSAAFSPDGRWVAYSVAGPPHTIFVQPYPPTGTKFEVTRGVHPFWSPDGSELFAIPLTRFAGVIRLGVSAPPRVSFTAPADLFSGGLISDGPSTERTVDVTRDGTHFVGIVPLSQPASLIDTTPQIRVVEHWFEELTKKAP